MIVCGGKIKILLNLNDIVWIYFVIYKWFLFVIKMLFVL